MINNKNNICNAIIIDGIDEFLGINLNFQHNKKHCSIVKNT